jgi:hypothetical protein
MEKCLTKTQQNKNKTKNVVMLLWFKYFNMIYLFTLMSGYICDLVGQCSAVGQDESDVLAELWRGFQPVPRLSHQSSMSTSCISQSDFLVGSMSVDFRTLTEIEKMQSYW